ncbi:hypothetical protein NDR87_02910 [Nocardia sp. CDC159]|uniref:Uncharacterized protein n=1 Tax=Nocardia pulmonis TaxID=2951408 RepID=A0A9X2E105_9NOCA|nr:MULTISPECIES: hypothetical protein [Nocardia]MCM6772037.1 hypothetical protein [Nocardia pulmonis]MCM6785305.1 hypothetical protein [Nocardia sp. CDC159]
MNTGHCCSSGVDYASMPGCPACDWTGESLDLPALARHFENGVHSALVTDTAPAAWLSDALGFGGRVATNFPASARILHPATDVTTGEAVSWASAARAFDRICPDRLDWILELADSDDWSAPAQGSLDRPQLDVVIDILARHTGTPGLCYFGVWEGWQWFDTVGRSAGRDGAIGLMQVLNPEDVLRETRRQACFELFDLRYLLLRGPIGDAGRIGGQITPRTLVMQSPNLLWPADRSWLLCTGIDDYETYVSGSAELVAELAASSLLEVERVSADRIEIGA